MDRRELLEAALQHLSTVIILLTAAGEDRLLSTLGNSRLVGFL